MDSNLRTALTLIGKNCHWDYCPIRLILNNTGGGIECHSLKGDRRFLYLLTDKLLIEVYIKATTLEHNDHFVRYLENEIKSRGLDIKEVLMNDKSGNKQE